MIFQEAVSKRPSGFASVRFRRDTKMALAKRDASVYQRQRLVILLVRNVDDPQASDGIDARCVRTPGRPPSHQPSYQV
jgi:hypothetical protein